MTEVQGLILESGKSAGILTADVVDSCRAAKRDRSTAMASPLLKLILERQGLSKADLDRLLERFWAQSGARRSQLHRLVEERIVATYIVEAGLAPEARVAVAEQEFEERVTGGDTVRLLSILVDTGTIDENAARQTVTEVQKVWKFCKYCLSSFKSAPANGAAAGGGGDACSICGRPLTVAARTYEIVKLKTIAEFKDAGPEPAGAPKPKQAEAKLPEVGESLAGVKLLERVDESGRGAVYRGQRAADGAPRAVKVWRLGKDLNRDDVARFETAALSATKLDDPGILKIFEAGEEAGRHFVVSEWVEGQTLRKLVEAKGPLPVDRAAKVLLAGLRSLDAAHREKLLHKNVTPGNLFVTAGDAVKIGEFGICKDYGVSLETVRGNVIGSPDYLAPEQCQGLKSDERTDLFSLGATLYYALAGKKPFEGDSTVSLVVKRLTSDAKPLREVAPKVPKELAEIVAKLMARKPEDRYRTAKETIAAVERWKARVEAGLEGVDEPGKLRKVAVAAGAVVALAGVAAAVIFGLRHFGGPNEAFVADVKSARALADRGLLLESAEKLRPLARSEGSGGDAAKALEDAGAKAIARANDVAKANDFPAAIDLVQRMKPSFAGLGLHAEAALDEAEKSLKQKREGYERDAKEAWSALDSGKGKLAPQEALAQVRDYRARWPHQPLDDAAKVREEQLAARQRQLDLLAEAEAKATVDPPAARARLGDAVALGEADADLEPRIAKVQRVIEYTIHMQEGARLSLAGETDRAIAEFDAAAQLYPDKPEVRAAKARAASEGVLRKARDEEAAQNWRAAIDLYRKADTLMSEAGLDATQIREKIRSLDAQYRAQKDKERAGNDRVVEGDRKAATGDWVGAVAAYTEAEKLLGPVPLVEEKLRLARRNAGGAVEEKAWKDLEAELARTGSPSTKVAALKGFLDAYPAGTYAGTATEMLEKIRVESGKLEDQPAAVAPRVRPLRDGERPGEKVNPSDGSTMVLIPAGKFKRGTTSAQARALAERWSLDEKLFRDEQPQRDVVLDAFYIDVQKVTNADYALFLAAMLADKERPHRWCHASETEDKKGRGHEPKYWNDDHWARSDLPVVGVDWFDAYAYAQWAGKRLPTEAEWEKAARGEDGRTYPWGDSDAPFAACTAEAWYGRPFTSWAEWKREFYSKSPWKEKGLSVGQTAFPVDRSPYGVMHLGGNVWEWCEDWYHPDAYVTLTDRNPVGVTAVKERKERVVRGGAWLSPLVECRAAGRGHKADPETRNFETGFRCARAADR